MATLAERIAEAKEAYHLLSIGKAVAEVRDSNGEFLRFTQAKKADLAAYIAELEAELAGNGSPPRRAPMRIFF